MLFVGCRGLEVEMLGVAWARDASEIFCRNAESLKVANVGFMVLFLQAILRRL